MLQDSGLYYVPLTLQCIYKCSDKGENLNIRDVLDEAGTNETGCYWKVVKGRRVLGSIRSLVNATLGLLRGSIQRECSGSHSVGRPRKRWIDTLKDF